MNGRKWMLALMAVMLFAIVPLQAFAEETNRNSVRAALAEGGWIVVYGDLINEADYLTVSGSIATAVATSNPGPIYAAFDDQLQAQINKIMRTAPDIVRTDLANMLLQAFKTQGRSIRKGRLEITAGMATYKRWERVVYDVPQIGRCKHKTRFGSIWVPCTKSVRKEKTVPYPNNFQPYIRYRWVQ